MQIANQDKSTPAVPSQENMSFTEINPCKVYFLNLLENANIYISRSLSLSI